MNISEYREHLLESVKDSEVKLHEDTKAILALAGNAQEIQNQINIISDDKSSAEEKKSAIDALNTASIFSPILRSKMPEFVNALRGQLTSKHEPIRHRAFGTLTAMKDEVAQERLVAEIKSDKDEKEKLVPTSMAISMLGRDLKAIPTPLLLRIASESSDETPQIEALRHIPADDESFATLKAIMLDDDRPLEARAMISKKINQTNPSAFLDTARELLESKGTGHDLAPFLVKGIKEISDPTAKTKIEETKKIISEMLDSSPEQFKNVANDLLSKPGDNIEE